MNTTPLFQFDQATHTYWARGVRLLGVSEIIQAAGLKDYSMVDPAVLERKADLGRAVHAACHYLDDGDLNWGTVSQEIEPYVRAWERFTLDVPMKGAVRETPIHDHILGIAGTPDSVFEPKTIIDIKTYPPDEVTGVQLSGYARIRFGPQPRVDAPRRWGVQLKPNGKYSLTEFNDRGDEAVFMAALTIARFKGAKR